MQSLRWHVGILAVCVLAGCVLSVSAAAGTAETVPWLTDNSFGSFWPNAFYAFTPDQSLRAILSFNPVIGDMTWTWTGDCNVQCEGVGSGPIIGGVASGAIQLTSNWSPVESFSGVIGGGTAVFQVYEGLYQSEIQDSYSYDFIGFWANGMQSWGSVFSMSDNGGGGDYTIASMTTYAPEPGTIALLSTGIVCGWRRWRRRHNLSS